MLTKIQHRLSQIGRQSLRAGKQPLRAGLMATIIAMTNVGVEPSEAAVDPAQVGAGFAVTSSDLAFILQQIKIAEYHAQHINDNPANPCAALVGNDPHQIPSPLLSLGLRTVDGTCNNIQPGQESYGAALEVFPRLTVPDFERPAEPIPAGFPGEGAGTNYNQTTANSMVFDSHPRLVSNLIVDQTSTNPAAVHVAGNPFRTQANPDIVVPCDTDPETGADLSTPEGCVPQYQTLFIPNITTDVGLSPPFNSLFTIFGQFFDHGVDKINNGGNGLVFVPLKDNDPLVAGPDHIFGNTDDLSPQLRFMVLTRGTIVNDPVTNVRSALNSDTPFVDQSQTYTSHPSAQVFTREYGPNLDGRPVATGKFLETNGGLPTWATVKSQARTLLGLELVDADVNNIPMVAADPYGNFIPGANGLPQYMTATGLVEGNLDTPVPAPANVLRIDIAFLNDIAHSAVPSGVPDGDDIAGGSLDTPVCPDGETVCYDNELLDLHFICGDGRCNENIALSAVHQVFHAEHNRLVDYFINSVDGVLTRTENEALWTDFRNVNLNPAPGEYKTFTYEERLFQAARFVTEMEYQHLVFEEFARKVQPLINPFQPFAFNQTDLNPATTAEFAHAVYRFGHSMLTDTIPRINPDGSHFDISLLDGFLNPAAYNDDGNGGRLSAPDAAGAILMGLSDQTGQEIDEFVTETLRNHLLGLPLDLPSINMARARSEGIPSLNDVRRQIFAETNDGQLRPYASWFEFGEKLKHQESLVNFVAAYGTHPTITAATTLADKRAAAQAIIDTMNTNPDARAFMFGTIPDTGVDDIDLWMGGLAENTNLFGGLLGPTFNYVFEKQLTDLQNGDRFYYLARTPGMNLRSQLEGNSFSELVMRNTPAHTLKADPFATADCKFELANLSATAEGFAQFGAIVADDPASECDESVLLARLPDGTIQYRAINAEDPPGINGQSVYNGTDSDDSMYGGNDNDTFWGGIGNDRIDGGAGDDVVLGGEGNDIITDFGGIDVLKGGPGNDAIDGGPGDDIIMSGEGKDFTNGGANINETFAGPGDDFAIAGQGEDAVFGDDGDDWEEGGDMPDLLIGDSSTLFFDDHNRPGHDILIGQGGDDDYDMEGGDDIGVAGPGVEKVAGASGYDWEIGLGDPQPQDADLDLLIVNTPPVNETRDRYNEVEALSGWKFNDKLRGDSIVPSQLGGGGFIGCDALDQAGLDRIGGLDDLVPPLAAGTATATASVIANSVTNYCMLTGDFVWGEGNILLGGEGSDELEGRGANDILDGDRYLNVRLSIRANPDGTGAELGTTELMTTRAAVGGNFGAGTENMTLQQAVFAGLVDPGQIVAVREILTPTVPVADCGAATPLNCDTALFSGPSVNYTITWNADDSVTVTDNSGGGGGGGGGTNDGTDILWNIEQLSFCRTPGLLRNTCDERELPISVASVIAPVAEVTPTLLAFGDQVVGATVTAQVLLASQAIRVTNSGLSNLVISGVAITGDTADFVFTNGCTAPVIPGGFCDISVQFAPTTEGDKTATISIAHNGTGSPSSVTVTGRGIPSAPIAVVTPAAPDALAFGNQVIGTSSAAQAITVTNSGTQDLIVDGASLTGFDAAQFSLTNGCATVVPGGSCSVTVQFNPTTLGDKTVSVDIVHNASGSPTSVTANGTGINEATTATIATARIGGGGGLRIGRSATGNVRVTNTGANPLVITSANVTGSGFTVALGACSAPVAPGRRCNLSVTFTPTAVREYEEILSITSNASNNPSATLTGRGR
jgi:Ca2+-binding RTX toxin-like protein